MMGGGPFAFEMAGEEGGMAARRPANKICDPSARPDAELASRFFSISVGGTYRTQEGLFARTRLLHKGGK